MDTSFEASDESPSIYKIRFMPSELKSLYNELLPNVSVCEVYDRLCKHVTSAIEPIGWHAIWRTVPNSPPHRLSTQYDLKVQVIDVLHNRLEAIAVVLRQIDPKESELTTDQFDEKERLLKDTQIVTIPLTQLYVISEDDPEAQYYQTAVTIEQIRFFYTNLWRPWDELDGSGQEVFVETKLKPRLELSFDINDKIVSESTVNRIKNLLTEGWAIKQKIDSIDAKKDDSHDISIEDNSDIDYINEANLLEAMRLKIKLEDIEREMRLLEDKRLRPIAASIYDNSSTDMNGVDEEVSKQNKIHLIAKGFTLKTSKEILNALSNVTVETDVPIMFHYSLGQALNHSKSGDKLYLSPGLYSCPTLSWIENDIEIHGFGGTSDQVVVEPNDSVGDIFLNCNSNKVVFSGLTLRATSELQCLVMVHTGFVSFTDCHLDGASHTRNALIVSSKGKVEIEKCRVVNERGTGIVWRKGSVVVNKDIQKDCGNDMNASIITQTLNNDSQHSQPSHQSSVTSNVTSNSMSMSSPFRPTMMSSPASSPVIQAHLNSSNSSIGQKRMNQSKENRLLKQKRKNYSKGESAEALQNALKEYARLGGLDNDGKAKKSANGVYEVEFKQLAKSYGVSRQRFSDEINGVKRQKQGKPSILNSDEKRIFINLIKLRALIGKPLIALELRQMAAEYLKMKTENSVLTELSQNTIKMPSKSWASDFVKEHNTELIVKIQKMVNKQRVKTITREVLDDFYILLEELFEMTGLQLDSKSDLEILRQITFNCDETGISLQRRKISFIFPRGDYQPIAIDEQIGYQYTTVLACGNANGAVICPYIIYRNVPEPISPLFKSWDKAHYRTSTSGWINSDLFNDWFENVFVPEAEKLRPEGYTGPLILLYDGHSTHYNKPLLQMAAKYDILVLQFPSHATHLLQPLDLSFFGQLKNILTTIIIERVTSEIPQSLDKDKFAEILQTAWSRIRPSWLRRGFDMSGIITENGINRTAVKDTAIATNIFYNPDGFRIIDSIIKELDEFNNSSDPTESFVNRRLRNILSRLKPCKTSVTHKINESKRLKRGSGCARIRNKKRKTTTIEKVVSDEVPQYRSKNIQWLSFPGFGTEAMPPPPLPPLPPQLDNVLIRKDHNKAVESPAPAEPCDDPPDRVVCDLSDHMRENTGQ